ncbi:unnamed protein product [Clonostachys solani]|uniref:MmgE/PrpD family protein n=1 Tax=Clonostachys solani TaxID=160281 RepID=A0A9N9Z0G8_9HYPO|nr:unnamed protein product [Clonostachys solani]
MAEKWDESESQKDKADVNRWSGDNTLTFATMDQTTTAQFAAFFSSLTISDIPQDIRTAASSLLLDTLTCIHASLPTSHAQAIKQLSTMFGGPGTASLAGSPSPVGTARALYANARLSNLLDLDETYPVGVHFGGAAVCAALAAAESEGKSAADMLVGIVAGYEAGARIASAVGPMMTVRDGHVQGFSKIWGVAAPVVVAACVAYARTAGVDATTLAQALGIACSNIPLPIGSRWSEAVDLPDCKYCDAGWCAVVGLNGVLGAQAGLTGFDDILDGEVGIPEFVAAAMPRKECLDEQFGEMWHLADITYKPWPTCRFMHSSLSALDRLLQKHPPDPAAIDSVVIHTGPLANSGRFRNPTPKTFCSYSFSYPHAVAMMVLGEVPGALWFDRRVADSEAALAIRAKVRVEELDGAETFAQDMVRNQMRKMPGAATLVINGRSWTEHMEYADGDPWESQTAYSPKRVEEKFRRCLGDTQVDVDGVLSWLANIENNPCLDPVTAFIRTNP